MLSCKPLSEKPVGTDSAGPPVKLNGARAWRVSTDYITNRLRRCNLRFFAFGLRAGFEPYYS